MSGSLLEKDRGKGVCWRGHKFLLYSRSHHRIQFKSRPSLGKALKRAHAELYLAALEKKCAVIKKIATSLCLLPEKNKMKHVTATTTTYDHVREYYERDDISRQASGMRDVVTVREGGVKKKIQKRHLTMSILEAYRYFKKEHPIIGKSKFAELRPSHVLRSSDTPRNVCLCRYHENVKLALDCLQHVIPRLVFQSTQDFVEAVACNTDSPLCMCWMHEWQALGNAYPL